MAIRPTAETAEKERELSSAAPLPAGSRERGEGGTVGEAASVEVSVVIPCLNEEDTLAACITKAREALAAGGIQGEIIVADNGSDDHSPAIAAALGARLVHVEEKGYGSALMGGIGAARGRYIIMGDADDSYDFREIPHFVARLRQGHDLVQGCRLPGGGGRVLPGAMPRLHRWWGNPMFTLLARAMFGTPVHDVYCGLRGFSRELYERLDQRSTGMEFATEMVVKASLLGSRIAEVPVTLHPDGRRTRRPHLKTFRDGWRTLRFLLMYSPRWLFFLPGLALMVLGLLGYALAMPGWTFLGARLDAHTLLFASLAILCGYQSVLFALFSKTFAVSEGLMPPDDRLARILRAVKLERGLVLGVLLGAAGGFLLLGAVDQWRRRHFGDLDYAQTMRWVIPGVTLSALGFQSVLASFFLSILQTRRR